jgi:hypothetical protein
MFAFFKPPAIAAVSFGDVVYSSGVSIRVISIKGSPPPFDKDSLPQ